MVTLATVECMCTTESEYKRYATIPPSLFYLITFHQLDLWGETTGIHLVFWLTFILKSFFLLMSCLRARLSRRLIQRWVKSVHHHRHASNCCASFLTIRELVQCNELFRPKWVLVYSVNVWDSSAMLVHTRPTLPVCFGM